MSVACSGAEFELRFILLRILVVQSISMVCACTSHVRSMHDNETYINIHYYHVNSVKC